MAVAWRAFEERRYVSITRKSSLSSKWLRLKESGANMAPLCDPLLLTDAQEYVAYEENQRAIQRRWI
jgi:hypothetical protein